MKRLEVSESKPILLDFVRNEIEVTKRDKEKIDTDFIKVSDYEREKRKLNREITRLHQTIKELEKMVENLQKVIDNQEDQIRRLRETNNLQTEQMRTILSTIETFRNERNVEEYD
ncbi:hypothetical protein C2G38_1504034 [Gigaspora rosea]|uniref:Uncharacterized protein n=1 Tax=Gigaspora rosea TaxID=44941 RepID=A0A397W2X5_9GLOM|nr:hypothetical protein C2G38_1504034 [Gigaspora rosea]